MILFFLTAAVLVVIVLALLLPVFTRNPETAEPNRTDVNIGIAKAQARELSQRHERGEISDEDYASEKIRLETGLARDIEKEEQSANADARGGWLLWPIAAAVPIAAGALYLSLGTLDAFDPEAYVAPVAATNANQNNNGQPSVEEMIEEIKLRLVQEPENPEAWFNLGRGYLITGQFEQAEAALREANKYDPDNIDVQIRLADAIALTQEGKLAGEPLQILKSALDTQPDHPQGLWLYGIALSETGDHAQAIGVWNKLLPQLSGDPQSTQQVEQLIATASAQMSGTAPAAAANVADNAANSAENSAGSIDVVVNVAADVADGIAADTPVFIYAKAVNGPPMPLAAVKVTYGDLPVSMTLTDEQAMVASMKISAFDEVIVGARIAKSGNPVAQSGDLFFESNPVAKREQTAPVQITISQTVP